MTPGDLLWLFFMLSALQPVLRQRFLEASRARLIARIERQRGSRVILLVHRQETMSILGFPVFRYIDVEHSEAGPAGDPPDRPERARRHRAAHARGSGPGLAPESGLGLRRWGAADRGW